MGDRAVDDDEPVGTPAGKGVGAPAPSPPTPPGAPPDWRDQPASSTDVGPPASTNQEGWQDWSGGWQGWEEDVGAPASEEQWSHWQWMEWLHGHKWAPGRGMTPAPKWEAWRWHYSDGAWWSKSYKTGPREGGYVPEKGKCTEANAKKEKRRIESLTTRWAQDAPDPEGAVERVTLK